MAEQMTGMLIEETLVIGTGAKHGQSRGQRIGAIGVVAATLALLLIGSMVMHNRAPSHSVALAIPRAVTSQQTRFLENNTTNLSNAVAADSRPDVITSEQQRYLDVNTTWMPAVAGVSVSPIITQVQERYWDVNTMLPVGPSYPYMEDMTPLPGHPR